MRVLVAEAESTDCEMNQAEDGLSTLVLGPGGVGYPDCAENQAEDGLSTLVLGPRRCWIPGLRKESGRGRP